MSHWTEEERNEALRRRMEGAPLMQGAPSLNSLKFVSKGEAVVVGGEVQDDFLPADSFGGSKEGYIFKKGSHGLGYYLDRGPNQNIEEGETSSSYDIEKHARGLKEPEREQRPGEGRVGALGDLLAENKAKKQEEFEKIIHDNRFCPPKALDDDEIEEERRTQREFRIEQAEQKAEKDSSIDLAKIMGQV
ncbi:hypothetical protein GUITHDRAFT_147556 [Guillardia theta CCMP2712]|uniref:Uncharacterized protein n=1 Tax=Guillardia theta (strain CCMP2712) TaxID=905079 RepID=L1ID17_GUITC|nr:hypothetical protein GUITHDRAFT_147556 [Guillardia theta CCMP2712]EKX33987.1 hypothetical protein GUITHDRAFT_147556 [Guillardia theta CCMP2712]|eukprot:XP_005820967.1 hypothetical protein GUITHDRAFT_147556 [Guillardia theta CCMP2712]